MNRFVPSENGIPLVLARLERRNPRNWRNQRTTERAGPLWFTVKGVLRAGRRRGAGSQILEFVAPGVGGLVAEELAGAAGGEQGAELGQLAGDRDVGEDLGHQIA
jgi:hypothetical protein